MSNVIKSFRLVEIEAPKSDRIDDPAVTDLQSTQVIEEYEKIIENAETEALKIIEDAESKQEEMVSSAYERAKDIWQASKDEGYQVGHQLGYNEGYDKGYVEGKRVSDAIIKESLEIKEKYLQMKEDLLKELEEDIINLVISIYEKIINKKTQEDEELIISLVLSGIKNLDISDKLTIITSKDDFNVLEMAKDEILAKSSLISELEIKYDMTFAKGDCLLETSKGNIDVSLKNQLEEVRDLLVTIMNNE
ncbi:MAG: FliH/SctL family protein [Tissierellaceae bacterium]